MLSFPFQTKLLSASRCSLKKTQYSRKWKSQGKKQKRKSQNKLVGDPALLEPLQALPLASMTIIDGL